MIHPAECLRETRRALRTLPKQDRNHPDVQTADREKVKRPRATEFLLDTLGKGRSVADTHGDKQVGDRRIVDPSDQSLSQPGAGAKGERHEGLPWFCRRICASFLCSTRKWVKMPWRDDHAAKSNCPGLRGGSILFSVPRNRTSSP